MRTEIVLDAVEMARWGAAPTILAVRVDGETLFIEAILCVATHEGSIIVAQNLEATTVDGVQAGAMSWNREKCP